MDFPQACTTIDFCRYSADIDRYRFPWTSIDIYYGRRGDRSRVGDGKKKGSRGGGGMPEGARVGREGRDPIFWENQLSTKEDMF